MPPRPAAPAPAPAATPAAARRPRCRPPRSSDPAQWGRVDEEGTVYVRTADGERAVGSWQAGEPAAGLAHYGRRYDDLATEVSLLEARLKAHTGNPAEIKNKAQVLAESIPTAAAVGDLDGLAARARAMVGTADSAAAESRAEKAAARAGADRPQGGAGRRGRADRRRVHLVEGRRRPAEGDRRGVEDDPRHRPQDRRGAVDPLRRRPGRLRPAPGRALRLARRPARRGPGGQAGAHRGGPGSWPPPPTGARPARRCGR